MALVNINTKLSDIVLSEPSIITVLNRFDIKFGLGDTAVKDICIEKDIDTDFFLAILNTFIYEEYFPAKVLNSFRATKIIDYLSKTNFYYEQFLIPNIERHFLLLISKSSDTNNLQFLMKFFIELKKELLTRIENDRKIWFPEIIELENRISREGNTLKEVEIRNYITENDLIEDKLSDLKYMFIAHLSGKYDINLGNAVLFAIVSLDKDIHQNNRIRNRILVPLSSMIKEIIK